MASHPIIRVVIMHVDKHGYDRRGDEDMDLYIPLCTKDI